jgi:biopolymer transport protein TolR
MGMAVGAKGGIKSDINVTPLVDVVLVLLIIFMVVTPMLQRGKEVTLPSVKQVDKHKKTEDPIILSVVPGGDMYLESDKMADEDDLETKLRDKLTGPNGNRPLMLKGDQTLPFEEVRKVMRVAKKAGAKAIALGVEELKE